MIDVTSCKCDFNGMQLVPKNRIRMHPNFRLRWYALVSCFSSGDVCFGNGVGSGVE